MTALIDPQALSQKLQRGDAITLIDATYPPRLSAPAIGDAIVFDIDAVADRDNPLAHTLLDAANFAAGVSQLGIGNDDTIVIYDQSGIAMAAARVWWIFRVFGHANVQVLDGGLPYWASLGLPLNPPRHAQRQPKHYQAIYNSALFADRQSVQASLGDPQTVIVDARDSLRFGNGHIPGSRNVPYATLIDPQTGKLKRDDERIISLLDNNPQCLIATCGSGVTACVLALAAFEAGRDNVAVYDGSWTEWVQSGLDMPIERYDPLT